MRTFTAITTLLSLFPFWIAGQSNSLAQIHISEVDIEDRPHFKIETPSATYLLDRPGGGLSQLIDTEGLDWIAFRKDPLNTFPDSAAAGYRGLPNLLFGSKNPEAGAGHPGFDRCLTECVSTNVLRTQTHSGNWEWFWHFSETHVTLTMTKTDPAYPFWFLYEGPVGGKWSPQTHFYGTDSDGPQTNRPDQSTQRFGRWQWLYVGDTSVKRGLLLLQRRPDELDDTYWYLGSTSLGINSPNGMAVFGFGRGKGTQPLLSSANLQFRFGLIDLADATDRHATHATMSASATTWLHKSEWPHVPTDFTSDRSN